MISLYSLITGLMLPFVIIRLYIKSIRQPAYRQRITERFGLKNGADSRVDVWLHAVSLGEVTAAIPLIAALLSQQKRIMVTTTTPTGSERLNAEFGDKVAHQYLPYDLLCIQRRFVHRLQPEKVIIMETELWPNLVRAAYEKGITLYLINARLSTRSLQGYKKIRWLIAPVLQKFSKILTQSPEDAERFISLGSNVEQVQAVGNIKFDCQPPALKYQDIAQALHKHCAEGCFVILAASTHAPEEEALLKVYARIKKNIPQAFLMIAPRHPERFGEVSRLVSQQGYNFGRRSQSASWSALCDGMVLDSIGELPAFYTISDLAFVGGSLAPLGGHNMLEPVFADVPVICGPFLHNFKAISRDLLAAKAMIRVEDTNHLADEILRLYRDYTARQTLINNAREVLESNKGALQRYLDYI